MNGPSQLGSPRLDHYSRLLATVSACVIGAAVAPAARAADVTPAAQSGVSSVSEVVVTGSALPTTNLKSISPVTVTSLEDIKQIGVVDVEAALRDMPETAPGRGDTTNNNGNGDTSANLRDLGPQRTLVLVDGKRMISSDSKGEVDLDAIPPAIIDHLEVVTGGASAVYGADAVAGVVNIILRKHFQGIELNVQGGAYSSGDGQKYDASILVGHNFDNDRGNVMAYFDYTKRTPMLSGDHSWANPQLTSNGVSLVPFNSGTIPAGRDLDLGLMFNGIGELVPYDGTRFNNYAGQYVITPQERFAGGILVDYQAQPWADFYLRAMVSRNDVDRQTHLGVGITDNVTVNFGNPFLSPQEQGILFSPGPHSPNDTTSFDFSKAFLASGNEGEQDTYKQYEIVAGVRGDLSPHFNYDVSAQYGETDWHQVLTGDISPERLQQALLVNPDGSCQDPSNGCVPVNIFTAADGAVTPAAAKFIDLTQSANSVTRQWIVSGLLTGDLGQFGIKSPWATNPVGIVLGADYRYENSSYSPDPKLAVGDNLVYGNIPPLSGHYDVAEVFFETRVPLVEDQSWAKLLEVEGGYRYSHYNRAGNTSTYKVGGIWEPIEDIRFRAAYEVAARAPNIGELFTVPQKENSTAIDPCFSNNGALPTASAALCQATGVPAGAYGNPLLQCPSQSCEVFQGGNVDLNVETAHSVTVGLAATPRFIPNFLATADYYNIKITNAVGVLASSAQVILDNCYGTGPGQNPSQTPSNLYCQAIKRSPAGDIFTGGFNGSVGDISLLAANVSLLSVSGIDYTLAYRLAFQDVGLNAIPGSLAVKGEATWVNSYKTQANTLLPSFECAGLFGLTCGQPIPRWRTSVRFTWAPDNDLSLSLRWRHISSVTLDNDAFTGTLTDPPDHQIRSFNYLDVAGSWRVTRRIVLRAVITDVVGTTPPELSRTIAQASIFGFSNSFPGTYDIGRQFSLGATVDF